MIINLKPLRIQRGETFTLDFDVENQKGHPFIVPLAAKNPFLTISVVSQEYRDDDDMRDTYWFDLNRVQYKNSDGTYDTKPVQKFKETYALPISAWTADAIKAAYPDITFADDSIEPANRGANDCRLYLFCVDANHDGSYAYRHITSCKTTGSINTLIFTDYFFRVVKDFDTTSWYAQNYLLDVKYVDGNIYNSDETMIPLSDITTRLVLLSPITINITNNIEEGSSYGK